MERPRVLLTEKPKLAQAPHSASHSPGSYSGSQRVPVRGSVERLAEETRYSGIWENMRIIWLVPKYSISVKLLHLVISTEQNRTQIFS